ncbi:MAG: cation diffusion facilitator family transporter, partial [Thermodesulfobacteriota bacterium]
DHPKHHPGHDHNLKAAYFHVLADALTSVLAVLALTLGKMFGWSRLDPGMGILGAVIIARWALGLLKDTSPILLDKTIQEVHSFQIRKLIEADSDNRVSDLHLWRVGPDDYAAIISVVTHFPKPVDHYKRLLTEIRRISHITVEVNQCMSEPCILPKSDTL